MKILVRSTPLVPTPYPVGEGNDGTSMFWARLIIEVFFL